MDYNRLDVQHIYADHSVPAADLTGATGQGMGEAFRQVNQVQREPAGGIPRQATAELVGLAYEMLVYAPSTSTTDGTVLGLVEISDDAQPKIVNQGTIDTTIDIDRTIDLGDVGETEDAGVLGILHAVAHSPFSDVGAGIGGGGMAARSVFRRNFRSEFSRGPIFDEDDEFRHHLALKASNIDDQSIHLSYVGQLLWRVET